MNNVDIKTPLVEFRDIHKRYGVGAAAFEALKGVNFRIDEGEFVAIMGPSGSGKSTTMNIIGALDRPTAGEYLFDGVHVEGLSRDQLAMLRRYHLGFVFQASICSPERRRSKTSNCRFSTAVFPAPNGTRRPWRRSSAWDLPTGRVTRLRNSRADSSSASPLRAPL